MTYKFNFYKLKIRSILTILNGKVKIELKIYFTFSWSPEQAFK